MKHYDILVVGSGPAGSAAAITAAKAGLSVGVVDKASFPRAKLCGGLITGRSAKALDHVFGLTLDPDLFYRSTHIRFLSDGTLLSEITDAPDMYLTQRWDFDAELHKRAIAAGVTAYLGQPFRDVDLAAHTVTLRNGTTLGYRCLIGADGVSSPVAKALFGQAYNPRTIGFGFEVEAPHDHPKSSAVEVDFSATDWGYGWSFPKPSSQTIGVGGVQSRSPNMASAMTRFVNQTGADTHGAKRKGHFLPFGDFSKTPGKGAVLLAGDAAGLVDPITGEGIALAIESGQLAAKAAIDALHAKAPKTAYRRYKRALRPIHRSLSHARRWRWMIFPKATQPAFIAAFTQGSSMPRRYLDLLAGRLEYSDLHGIYLRKLPKAAMALLRKRFS